MLFQMHSWAVEKSLQIHTILVTITYCIYNISIDRCISSMYINSLGLRTCHSSLHRHSSCLERRGNIRTRLPLSLWLLADACHCQSTSCIDASWNLHIWIFSHDMIYIIELVLSVFQSSILFERFSTSPVLGLDLEVYLRLLVCLHLQEVSWEISFSATILMFENSIDF